MRRLPPKQVNKSLAGVGELIEDEELKQNIFESVDQPLEIAVDESTSKEYIKHEYNRDGDSYRSPWTNKFYPACDATFFPSTELLSLEQKCNDVFSQYVKLYYDFAISSVYLADAA